MKIAVIGSGITGLSAVWYLGKAHKVTLYERAKTLGMDAHTAEVESGQARALINVPMRVFFEAYYPNLTELYQELGVAYEPIKYSGSFSHFGGSTYFRYKNYWLGSRSIPLLAGRSALTPRAIGIGREILRFLRASTDREEPLSDDTSIEQYLQQEGYSRQFAECFLYPAFAGICTCRYESIKSYPASIIREYLQSGLMGSRVNRLVHGTQDAARRMVAAADKFHYNMNLKTVTRTADSVQVSDGNGHTESYDHAVIATQADQALKLLGQASRDEQSILRKFRYEAGKVVVHRDARLAPNNRKEWAPVNFLLSAEHDKPMASIWMNQIHPELKGKENIFETWNPFLEIPQDKLLLETQFERPVVSPDSLRGIDELHDLHQESDRRIWFCGSYSRRGIPLLESAAASAKDVASRIGALPGQMARD